jgi:GyrI-like small molecule binding domain
VTSKKRLPALADARLESFTEGHAAQILHVGPYSTEGPTIASLHEYIAEQGFHFDGRRQKHHEIYLGDPRRAAPPRSGSGQSSASRSSPGSRDMTPQPAPTTAMCPHESVSEHAPFDTRPVVAFFVLAYAFSWAWVIAWAATGHTVAQGQGWPTRLPSLLGPMLAAFVVTVFTTGPDGIRDLVIRMVRWRIGWRWWVIVVSPSRSSLSWA